MDFFEPSAKLVKGVYQVAPKFRICTSKDLMIRGHDFYAVWDEENGVWSKSQDTVIKIIDKETKKFCQDHKNEDEAYRPQYMWDADTGVIDRWIKYTTKQLKDNYKPLDNKLIFSNTVVKREDYSTHRLNYPLEAGKTEAYDELMSTLYEPDERKKLEWAIGAIVSGDSVWIQKFIVIVGDPGTGKSTFFKLLRMLFPGYLATINAKNLGNPNSSFALEPLKNDPLVAIEDDSDLSKISDNTRLNSLVSHEPMTVNEKFKAQYENTFHAFIFLGSNKDVKITDSASGLTRRLIDVVPSGNKIPFDRYTEIMSRLPFELGAIAHKCLQVYYHNKKKYNDYVPVRMLRATNLIYNFLEEYHEELIINDGCRFTDMWNAYNRYCDLSKVQYAHNRQEFRNELRPYFKEYLNSYEYAPGQKCSGYYRGFKYEKLGLVNPNVPKTEEINQEENDIPDWLNLNSTESKLDSYLSEYPAQYEKESGGPEKKWVNVKTKLKDVKTNELHWVKCPENLITIDFDKKNEAGEKDKTANIEAAKQFPPTYAEWSKSGGGLHLTYLYKGNVDDLSRFYDDSIEVKVFKGDASLRRKLSTCNSIDISEISCGLPLKERGKKTVDSQSLSNEKALRTFIKRNLNKEYHAYTTPSIQFIKKGLDDAYENTELKYDVTDMRQAILNMACASTNQSDLCVSLVNDMKFKSKCYEENESRQMSMTDGKKTAFYDVEVFKNVFIVCWTYEDSEQVNMLVQPSSKDVEWMYNNLNLIGFNNRSYDAHIMYGKMLGYSNAQLYNLSRRLITGSGSGFSEAYYNDYADIYDFSSTKQSLKKWEIKLGITHLENSYDWDEPLPEDKWKEVADYCCNDVRATKKVFEKCHADWIARQIISELSGLPLIATNRQHITKFIFNGDKKPNLVYTDLATGKQTYLDGTPAPKTTEFCNSFPGYEFKPFGFAKEDYDEESTSRKSRYLGCDPSEGGYVFSKPGMYVDVWCFDVGGMHPASAIALNKFGEYTSRYKEVRDARVFIKHGDYKSAGKLLGGILKKHLTNKGDAKNLSKALKLILNSTYGFCSATFDNPFRDPRDVDNIVAKRGALFMITLRKKVEEMGYEVIHCKTDSIKVVNPDKRIIDFINDFGHKYGYEFEVEHKFQKICLVNRSVYIGYEDYDDIHGWIATGTEFAVPYVFKTLFSKEPIAFDDYCVTKSVSKGSMYLDFNEKHTALPELEKEYSKLLRKQTDLKTSPDEDKRIEELAELTESMHNRNFVGRIGRFVSVKNGLNGGTLEAKRDNKYASVAGTKGYRWMEAESFKICHSTDDVDISYYRKLCDDAMADIEKYGNYDSFISEDPEVYKYAAYPF